MNNNHNAHRDFSLPFDNNKSRPENRTEIFALVKALTKDCVLMPDYSDIDFIDEIDKAIQKELGL